MIALFISQKSDLNPVNKLLVVACKILKRPIFFQAELFLRVSSSYTTHYSDGRAAPPVFMETKCPNMGKPLKQCAGSWRGMDPGSGSCFLIGQPARHLPTPVSERRLTAEETQLLLQPANSEGQVTGGQHQDKH